MVRFEDFVVHATYGVRLIDVLMQKYKVIAYALT